MSETSLHWCAVLALLIQQFGRLGSLLSWRTNAEHLHSGIKLLKLGIDFSFFPILKIGLINETLLYTVCMNMKCYI